jgi:DNA-binding GntR family transcriptional regulator
VRKLEVEGLIQVHAQRGIQITDAGPKAIKDAYDYRRLLELAAVRALAETATPAQLAAFRHEEERSLALLAAAPEDEAVCREVLDRDYAFHKRLIDAQDNAIISQHYSMNAARLRLFRVNLGEPLERLGVSAREHLAILDACAARDPDLAAARLAEHIEISREHTLGLRPMRRVTPRRDAALARAD